MTSPEKRAHPHLGATYEIPEKDRLFAVRVTIPETQPATVSGFKSRGTPSNGSNGIGPASPRACATDKFQQTAEELIARTCQAVSPKARLPLPGGGIDAPPSPAKVAGVGALSDSCGSAVQARRNDFISGEGAEPGRGTRNSVTANIWLLTGGHPPRR